MKENSVPGLVNQFTFLAGCLARTPFRDQVSAAAAAGFDSISIWPNIWRHAMRKDGLSIFDMRAMLDDHGLKMTDVDAYRDWAPPPTQDSLAFGPNKSGIPRRECLEVCAALGGTTIVAVHLTDVPLNYDRDIEAFATLCDDAAEHGLRIGLEFVAFSNIPDVATAMKIVDGAARDNGGLIVDLWHHARSTFDNAALAKVPGEKVYTVQFSDGPAQSPYGLVEEAMYHRQWPGAGDLDVTGFLQTLDSIGASASIGAELYQASFQDRDPMAVVREVADASRASFAAAGIAMPKHAVASA
jgi:sugar phosphate isomerase/epimerase